MKYYILYIAFLLSFPIYAQDLSQRALQKLDDEDLLELFDEVIKDSLKAEIVARVYLDRAKSDGDTIKMARGYDRLARIFSSIRNIQYADSIIFLTKNINHITYPAIGYIIKGYEYGVLRDTKSEAENYLTAYDQAIKNNNLLQQLYITDRLIFLKSVWGNKREALKLQKKRHKIVYDKDYIKKINKSTRKSASVYHSKAYLKDEISSIQNFVFCYLNLKLLDSAKIFVDLGKEKSLKIKGDRNLYYWFLECSIEIEYYNAEYEKSIEISDSLLSIFHNLNNEYISLQNIYLFKGLSQLEIDNYDKGILNLKKSDSIFEANNLIISQPYQRILFEKLLEYYNSKSDIEQKIKYLNKLITADSIIKKNYQYFEPSLIKNFETPLLIKEKEQLITELKKKNNISRTTIWWSFGLLIITLIALGYYFRKQHNYKRRFENLMIKTENKNRPISGTIKSEISKTIIEDILNKLDQFEMNRGYLSQSTSLMGLAKKFGTNYKYLSKIINLNKAKRFSNYINDMRVNYAFNELKNNSKFRKFTIKAIAAECGFRNSESFTKAFYKVYGIYPSFYIKQLDRKKVE